MTILEYFCGLAVLLLGFNIGFYEAGKGLNLEDLKKIYRLVLNKFKSNID